MPPSGDASFRTCFLQDLLPSGDPSFRRCFLQDLPPSGDASFETCLLRDLPPSGDASFQTCLLQDLPLSGPASFRTSINLKFPSQALQTDPKHPIISGSLGLNVQLEFFKLEERHGRSSFIGEQTAAGERETQQITK
uniref:Uncharacterized protein n=1 Tax=Fundulus heteroclitus TaxID=8078 RepID=A0A3Q2UJL5_FUNHE